MTAHSPAQQIARLASRYGVSVPAPLAEARARVASLIQARSEAATSPASFVGDVLTAEDPGKAAEKGAKAISEGKAREAILAEAEKVAVVRADRVALEVAPEIADGILASAVAREAFAVLADLAPRTAKTTPYDPEIDTHGAEAVVAAARIRQAHEALRRLVVDLDRDLGLGVLNVDAANSIDTAEIDRVVGVLIADPATAKDPAAFDRAARGLVGPDGGAFQIRTGMPGGAFLPIGTQRLAAVLLAHEPGVTLSLASSLSDLEARIRSHASRKARVAALAEAEVKSKVSAGSAPDVVWG